MSMEGPGVWPKRLFFGTCYSLSSISSASSLEARQSRGTGAHGEDTAAGWSGYRRDKAAAVIARLMAIVAWVWCGLGRLA